MCASSASNRCGNGTHGAGTSDEAMNTNSCRNALCRSTEGPADADGSDEEDETEGAAAATACSEEEGEKSAVASEGQIARAASTKAAVRASECPRVTTVTNAPPPAPP